MKRSVDAAYLTSSMESNSGRAWEKKTYNKKEPIELEVAIVLMMVC
jgi:hypothetical protein